MAAAHPNSFKARKTLKVGSRSYTYFSLKAVEKEVGDLSRLPFSLRVLMENLLRHEDGTTVKKADISAFAEWLKNGGRSTKEINFRPARVLMQDFTGVPAWSTSPPCATRWASWAATPRRSTRWCRSTS
jgi:aconitate hydratase